MKKLLLSMVIAFTASAMMFGQTEVLINDFTGTLDPAKIFGDNYDAAGAPNQSTVTFENNMLRADYIWNKPDWFPRAVWYHFDDYMDLSTTPVLEVKFMVEDNDNETLEVRLDLFGDGEEPVNDTIREMMETNGNPWIIVADNGTWYTEGSDFTEENRFFCTYWNGGIAPTRIDSTRINGFEAFVNAGKADLANQPGTLWIDYIEARDVMTGVSEVIYGAKNAFGLAVYPSPTSGLLKINSENSVSRVELYNITGKLVSTIQNVNERQFEINVSDLAHGLYVTNIYDQKGQVVSKKFIKE